MIVVWVKYGKTIAALVIAALTAVQAALSDGHVTTQEGVQIAIAVVTAAGVYLVPAVPRWPWVKTAIGVLLAALNVMTTLIIGGISSGDLVEIALAALTALGVAASPARSESVAPVPPTVPPTA